MPKVVIGIYSLILINFYDEMNSFSCFFNQRLPRKYTFNSEKGSIKNFYPRYKVLSIAIFEKNQFRHTDVFDNVLSTTASGLQKATRLKQ